MASVLESKNKLKLGVFGATVSGGLTPTQAPGALEINWPNTKDIVVTADRAGFEVQVPVARWKALPGKTQFNGVCYEPTAWAAALGSITNHTTLFSTTHVPAIHPVVAAKQYTTVDHASGGRFGLNLVCGWNEAEFRMFGVQLVDHDERYNYAAEWLHVVRECWTRQDEFDFEGKYFKIAKGYAQPKPLQTPHPPVMNAGRSGIGRAFAAKHADIAFTAMNDIDIVANTPQIDEFRRIGRDDYNRSFQLWSSAYVVCRPTEKEAKDYVNYYVNEMGDWEAAEFIFTDGPTGRTLLTTEQLRIARHRLVAGWGGLPLVGTPEMIVDSMLKIPRAGLDGIVLSWVNYQTEMRDFIQQVLPLMEQAGLRQPYVAGPLT